MALHHAKPGEVVDLRPIGRDLNTAQSTAIVKTSQFEAIRLIIPAGAEIPPHQVGGSITLHCLQGEVELGLAAAPVALKANQWIYLDGGMPHSVKAVEDASLLLTILLQPRTDPAER
ncbi:MAG: cupin domain-containing protein [Sphingomonadales bacterium]